MQMICHKTETERAEPQSDKHTWMTSFVQAETRWMPYKARSLVAFHAADYSAPTQSNQQNKILLTTITQCCWMIHTSLMCI